MTCSKTRRLSYTRTAKDVLSRMTLEEKTALMTGNSDVSRLLEEWHQNENYSYYPYTSAGNAGQGIPGIAFCDGPRGIVCGIGKSTCFPAPVCRGASFDTTLEMKIGQALGREAQAYGATLFGGVCVNLPFHPGWGRSQETYGEESFAIGQMASSLIRGVQSENVMACVKHYAFNTMENGRFSVNVRCDPRTEQEVYLPHFRDCVAAGAACVMGAYNSYQGEPACGSRHLLKHLLKEQWGFDGFVISDWFWGIKDTVQSANAGLDLEMPAENFYGKKLAEAVRRGLVPEEAVDDSALRIIRTVLAFEEARRKSGAIYTEEILGCETHVSLSLQSAREGITLLKNEGSILPFRKQGIRRMAVIGPLALRDNLGDHGSGRVFPRHAITPMEGISALLPDAEIIYYSGDDIVHAQDVARAADASVFLVGLSYEDEGEHSGTTCGVNFDTVIGGDRSSLALKEHDIRLLQEAGSVNPHTAVVLIGGGTILLDPWIDSVPSVLMAYYPGQEGGRAIAEILFGQVNPSGKLPFVIPKQEEDLPAIDWGAKEQWYDYYHGYAKLEKEGISPRLPYGFGLSYTTFALSDPDFLADERHIRASCRIRNTGPVKGTEVVQLYIGFDHSGVDRPHKLLRGFSRVTLRPGEEKVISLVCPLERLSYYDPAADRFVLEHMEYEVYLGTSSDEHDLLRGSVLL